MKYIIVILFALLCVSCATHIAEPAKTQTQELVVNEHIDFLKRLDRGDMSYPAEELNKWRMQEGSEAIPESADFNNLDHVRLFVSANPNRYEGFANYGTHFFHKQEFGIAVAAYEYATRIVDQQNIENPVNYRKYYSRALAILYMQQREQDIGKALDSFSELVRLDFSLFDQEPKLVGLIALAALDYSNTDRNTEAKKLIEQARQLGSVPSDITEKLEWLYSKIIGEQESGPVRK
jgi:tetratricopeptide (TPR) repeat protein